MTSPSAKQIAREFQGGKSIFSLRLDHNLSLETVEAAIRKYVFPGGKK